MNYFIKNEMLDWVGNYEQVDKEVLMHMLKEYHEHNDILPPIRLNNIEGDNMYFVIDYVNNKKNIFQKIVDFFR